jgi:predicted DsbA family dithiol-disulfide isomerase
LIPIKVDIVSDVVCPWCIVGLRQLQTAVEASGIEIDVHWHPFELNPGMPDVGQNLREHICEKYGTSIEQSNEARQRLVVVGKDLGFDFHFDDESRMVNTFKAHQLLHWANLQGQEHALKLALFSAYFTEQADINNTDVLLGIVESIGLDVDEAKSVLADGLYQDKVCSEQQSWTSRGITGVPAMVFDGQYLVTGAQGVENYTQILNKIAAEVSEPS